MSTHTPVFSVRSRLASRLFIAVVSTVALGSLGCDGCGDPDETKSDEHVEIADAGIDTDADPDVVVDVDSLAPQFREFLTGPQPSVVVSFAHPIAEESPETHAEHGHARGFPRPASMETRLEVTPFVSGSVWLKHESALEFRPDEPFRPGVEYTVELTAVATSHQTLTPDSAWTHTFRAPDFELVRVSHAVLEAKTGQAFVDLEFSAEPDLETVNELSSWALGNRSITGVTYGPGYAPNVVRASLRLGVVLDDASLGFTLDRGAKWAHDSEISAPAHAAQVRIRRGPQVHLHGSAAAESPTGHYVEVICQDTAAPGGSRYHWNRNMRRSFQVSSRCMPTEESIRSAIRITPDVEFEVVPGEAGFNLVGDFKRGSHRLEIAAGMTTIDGGVLPQGFESDLDIQPRTPQIEFVNTGRYIPRSHWKHLELRHLNLPSVEIEARHIPADNVLFWLSQNDESARASVANVVARERTDLSKTDEDKSGSTVLDAANFIGQPQPGVYELTARSKNESSAVRLLVTDINLIAKRSAAAPGEPWSDEILVWAIDMKDASPRLGVEIEVVRASGKAMATCVTNSEGRCTLDVEPPGIDPNPPVALIARDGEDFTYLKFSELETDTSAFATHGPPYLDDAAYRASVYSSRDLFRPGEEAHFVAILRDRSHEAPADLPVEIVLTDARQNTLRQVVTRTNEAGMIEFSERFNDFAATGVYTLEIKVGKRTLKTHRFSVEEFVPERMNIDANFDSSRYVSDETPAVEIEATYLFGASASGSDVDMTCRIEHDTFTPEGAGDYAFGLAKSVRDVSPFEFESRSATLDENGRATIDCPAFEADQHPAGKLVAELAVFEAGSGRTSKAEATSRVHAETYHLGLKTSANEIEVGDSFAVEGVVVDDAGKRVDTVDTVEIEFIRLQRQHYRYQGIEDLKSTRGYSMDAMVEDRQEVPVRDGRFSYRSSAKNFGSFYVVRATAGNTATELSLRGKGRYWRSRRSHVDQTPRPSRAAELAITGPDTIEVGSPATFEVEVPFKGRLLMTVETHEVVEHAWFDASEGTFEWEFSLDDFAPSVYLSGLLIKDPHADSADAFTPERAYGTLSTQVEPTQHTHEVRLQVPEEIEPNSELEVVVEVGDATADSTYVTLAAVDEGVLSITNFASPNPNRELFGRRALGVSTFETIGWGIDSNPSGTTSSTGGGGEMMEPPGESLSRPMGIKPVAFWSGLVKVEQGQARVTFDVPRYRGKLRVMAVAASPGRTGHADAHVTVRDPLVLQTTLPRFLSAGDEAHIPVFVTNMTGKPGTVNVSLTTQDIDSRATHGDQRIVEVVGEASKSVSLQREESGTVVFAVRGLRQAGTAEFRVEARLGATVSYDEGIVPFRPNGPQEQRVHSIELTSGVNPLSDALSGWVPTSERTSVWVTPNPFGTAFSHLEHLVRYPHGCLEQTVSRARPLLFVDDLVRLNAPEAVAQGGSIEAMVESGIKRVLSMQTPGGGFAYWPSASSASPWASAYAIHFLLDARKRGYTVPGPALDRALKWLSQMVATPPSSERYSSNPHPYAHLTLALAEKGKPAQALQMIRKIGTPQTGAAVEHLYMLKAALYLAGDRRYEKDLRALDGLDLESERDDRWSYYSNKRRNAFIVATFIELFGKDDAVQSHVRSIAGDLQRTSKSHRFTTQELTWSVTALGKWISGDSGSFSNAELRLSSKAVKPDHEVGSKERVWSVYRASEYESVDVKVDDIKGKVYAVLSSSGVRKNPEIAYGGQALRISRTFLDAAGNEIEPDSHELGDLVYTRITVENTTSRALYNLALVDRLAAGWEIENPRLNRATQPDWVNGSSLWNVEHMDLRDDRIEVFGALAPRQAVTFVYAMRSATSGKFFSPGPEVKGMYDPDVWARSQPARVAIQGPWDDYLN